MSPAAHARHGVIPAALAAFIFTLTLGMRRAEPAPTGPKEADDLAGEAESFAKRGMYAQSLKRCEKALTINDAHARALTACTLAACNLKLAKRAKAYHERLKAYPERHAVTRQVCLRNGIDLN